MQRGQSQALKMRDGWFVDENAPTRAALTRHRLRAQSEPDGHTRALCSSQAGEWVEEQTITGAPCPSCVEIEMELDQEQMR
jgi:hypothetical protein